MRNIIQFSLCFICFSITWPAPAAAQESGRSDRSVDELVKLLKSYEEPGAKSPSLSEDTEDRERGAGGTAATKPKVHWIVVVDTQDDKIGTSVAVDLENVMKFIIKPLREHHSLGEGYVFRDDEVTGKDVLGYIDHLRVRTDDTIFFYFAGHGGMDWKNEHFLQMQSGSALNRWDVKRAIFRKNPRLAVLLTDTCSTRNKEVKYGGVPKANWTIVARLFLQFRGVVDITAAKPGEAASGYEAGGGYFTSALMRILCTEHKETLYYKGYNWSWLVGAIDTVIKNDSGLTQTPHAFYIGSWPTGVAKRGENPESNKIPLSLDGITFKSGGTPEPIKNPGGGRKDTSTSEVTVQGDNTGEDEHSSVPYA